MTKETNLINQLKELKEQFGNSVSAIVTLDEIIAGLEPKVWIPPKNTPVIVGGNTPRYSTGKLDDSGRLLCYRGGKTSFTIGTTNPYPWDNWHPLPSANHIINWIEHDGSSERPFDPSEAIIGVNNGGSIFYGEADSVFWDVIKKYITLESLRGG